ncbi:MAG: minor capsid protein [Candidatus Heimdallarchaeota archaeon]
MIDPTVIIRDLLVTAGVGNFAATIGWGIYIHKEPEAPDSVITIYETGGKPPNPAWLLDFPSIQVRIRGSKGDSVLARAKASEVMDNLLGAPYQAVTGGDLGSITSIGGINSLGWDKNNRPIFTTNFNLILEPSEGLNRQAI